MKIYQIVSYLNAFNKKLEKWENLYSVTIIAVGKEGLKTLYSEFEREQSRNSYERTVNNYRKYSKVRGKVEIHEPHIHENGTIAYWGYKILKSYNPDNI